VLTRSNYSSHSTHRCKRTESGCWTYIVKKTEFTNTLACLQHRWPLRHHQPPKAPTATRSFVCLIDDVSSANVSPGQRSASAAAIAMLEFVLGDSASYIQRKGSTPTNHCTHNGPRNHRTLRPHRYLSFRCGSAGVYGSGCLACSILSYCSCCRPFCFRWHSSLNLATSRSGLGT
jgi:hypothetical protein